MNLDLTEMEAEIVRRSADAAITHRRIRLVIFFAGLFAITFLAAGYLLQSRTALVLVGLLYIAITTFEKVGYGRGVLLYKSVIQKLSRRIEELEQGGV